MRITHTNPAGIRAGVRAGQSLEAALAVAPDLESRPRHPGMEHQILQEVALVAYSHSHQVALAIPDTVLLEIGGSQKLRGGIEPLIEALGEALDKGGLAIRAGIAPFPATARLLARTGDRVLSRESLLDCLRQLPLRALPLERGTLDALSGCGLKTAGELLALPVPERARRFGPALNRYLEEIQGTSPTPLATWQPAETFTLELTLPVATADAAALGFAINRGLDALGHWLQVRDQALHRLRIGLQREDSGPTTTLMLGLARPGFDRERLMELVRLKLEDTRLNAPIQSLSLYADTTSEHRPPQADLWPGASRGDAWPALLDRLTTRLGEDAVYGLVPRPDHRPEKAWSWAPPGTTAILEESRTRPNWLLPVPRPCSRENLVLEEGPERIETGWWDGEDCRRDYWVARDQAGSRLWIFREYKPRCGWFIHGFFG